MTDIFSNDPLKSNRQADFIFLIAMADEIQSAIYFFCYILA